MDFGATDGPMNESQIQAVTANVLHIPTVLGAVVVTYNLPALGDTKLKFDGPRWSTSSWAGSPSGTTTSSPPSTPGVKLPDDDVIVVHRSDGSGTSYIFTDYLNKVSRSGRTRSGTPPR